MPAESPCYFFSARPNSASHLPVLKIPVLPDLLSRISSQLFSLCMYRSPCLFLNHFFEVAGQDYPSRSKPFPYALSCNSP